MYIYIFACRQRVLKTFPGTKYLCLLRWWVVWLWNLLVRLYIWVTIPSCYGPIPLTLEVDREGWCFEQSLSCLRVCLWAGSTKNVSWPWLSPLREWGSQKIRINHLQHFDFCLFWEILIIQFTLKFLYFIH